MIIQFRHPAPAHQAPSSNFPFSSSKSQTSSNKFPIPSSTPWCHLDNDTHSQGERSLKFPVSHSSFLVPGTQRYGGILDIRDA